MAHRTVKHVPLDFNWPLKQTWSGYLPPNWRPCPAGCEHGLTLAGRWLECLTSLILLAGEAGATGHLHPWLAEVPLAPARPPGQDMADLTTGLAGRGPQGRMGHDAIDRWSATKELASAAGMPEGWGVCPTCKGHAIHPDDQAASEAWQETEPPTGDGWQLWETTSEGSPVSPVFATPEELAAWCEGNATIFASEHLMTEQWLRLIREDEVEHGSMLIGADGYLGSYAGAPKAP